MISVLQQECKTNPNCDYWVYFDKNGNPQSSHTNPKLKDCFLVSKTHYLGTEPVKDWCAPSEGTECIISGPKNCGDPKLGTIVYISYVQFVLRLL